MGIDTSIYQSIRPYQAPDVIDSAQKAASLAQLGMQIQTQQAMRNAYTNNIGPDGKLDQQGYLSELGKSAPQAAIEQQQMLTKMNKEQADTQTSQAEAYQRRAAIAARGIDYVAKLPPELQEQGYNDMVNHLVGAGVASPGQFPAYSPETLNGLVVRSQQHMGQNTKDYQDVEETKAKVGQTKASTAKTYADIGEIGDKRLQALKDDLDPNKARGGNLAKSQSVINASDRLNGIFKQFPDYNIPKAQQTELVSAFGSLLNGGSSPFVSQLEELVPKSARGNANAIASWVLNQPMGSDQQQFMKLLHDSVNRERDIATDQVRTAQVQRLPSHDLLRKTNPEGYAAVLSGYGIKPDNIQNGKYIPSQGPSDELASGGGEQIQSIGTMLAGKKKDDANAYAGKTGGITDKDASALKWLKSADPSDPTTFAVKAKLRAKGLIK